MRKRPTIFLQLILGFSCIFLFSFSIMGYFSYRHSSQIVLDKTTQLLLESVIQMRGKTDVMLGEFDRNSQMIAFSPMVQNYYSNIVRQRGNNHSKAEIERFMKSLSRYSGSDFGITILDTEGRFYQSNESLFLFWRTLEDLKQNKWYPLMESGQGQLFWLSGPAWRNGPIPAVIGVRLLNDLSTMDKIGNLFIVFPVEALERTIEGTSINPSHKIQLIDRLGTILYSTDKNEIGTELNRKLQETMGQQKTDIIAWKEHDTQTYISYSSSEYSGWTVASYIKASEAVKDVLQIQQTFFITGLSGLFAALLFTVFFSWTVSRPIRYLGRRLTRLEKGHLPLVKSPFVNREVELLYDSFTDMMERLEQTVQDLSEKQISEKQAQIIALKAQFQPHFLYNSLNTIYWLLVDEGQEKVARIVLSLSDLLRYSIQPGSEMVTIKEDLEQLERYRLLVQARYGDKLQLEINIKDELLNYRIMKLLLQPLVENAMTHGLESIKGRPWKICIDISKQEHTLRFIVEDNGKGMTDEEMASALHFSKDTDHLQLLGTGLGLANLHYRVGLIYGKEYGLQLYKSEMGGLRAEVVFPLIGGGN